jgi:hypothetical protein
MAIEKVIDIKIESNADERVGSLRSQLREAQADVAALSEKFGVTSKEAIEAAKRAGQLKDQIADARALTDAFNPDAKFKALSSSLAGVAGGFAALQGAQSLFGEQSKEVEQTLLKVQAAMALSQGLQTIGESVDSFKQLSAVAKSYTIVQKIVTAGQYLWNAALAANPIGALVVVIAALIAAGVALVNYFKGASAATAQNTAAVKENEKAIKSQSQTLDKNSAELQRKQSHELAMAKASGASASAIRALELKLIDEKIAYEKSAKAVAMNTYEKNKNYLMSLKASGADEDLIKKQTEVVNESVKQVNKQSENLKKAYDERKDIQLRHQVEIRQAETNHNKEVADKNKEAANKAREDAKEAAKKKAEDKKKFDEETQKGIEDLNKSQADAEKRRQDDAQKILDDLAKSQETPAQKLEREFQEKKAILEAANKSTFELEMQHISDMENMDAEQKQKQLDKEKATADAKVKIAQAEAKAKMDALDSYGSALGSIAGMLGESTTAGKAAAVASATISTYSAANKAYESQLAIPTPDAPIRATIAAGIAIAGGLLNVQKILAVKTPGGGGSGGTAPSGGNSMTAPSFNTVGSSSTNQLAQSIGSQSQTPIRSYVVASDVSTAQALDRNIIKNATIGG